jgi:hypothetical protein
MSEKQPPREEEATHKRSTEGKSDILLALIEHGSRPAAMALVGLFVILWLFSAKDPLFGLLRQAETLKFGAFEIELRNIAESANLDKELNALVTLTDEQLQLFLVVGKKRAHIRYEGEELTEENLRKLYEVGLLAEWRNEPDGGYWWRVSEKGNTLHDIIRGLVFSQLRRSGA